MKKLSDFLLLTLLSCLTTFLLSGPFAAPSAAHWADLSVAEILVGDTDAQVTLTLPTGLMSFADDDQSGQLSSSEVQAHRAELEDFLGDRLSLSNHANQPGTLTLQSAAAPDLPDLQNADTHSTLQLTYTWPTRLQNLTVDYGLFPVGATAQCLATISAAGTSQSFVFTPDNSIFMLRPEAESSGTAARGSAWGQQARSFIQLGIEHIFTGYDHILFLLSLMLLGGGLRDLLKLVTAFTVAHSITLSMATLDVVTLPSALVESLIALSIVYVATENLWRKEVKHRWLITFGFGLIHGLGFAGIFQDLGGTSSGMSENLVLSLASFNLGVELGQVAIVTLAFLVLRLIRRQAWALTFRRVSSVAMVAMGLVWFAERALG